MKNFLWNTLRYGDMGWNGMNADRIASKDCIIVDFGICDIEIQSLLLRFISAPSKWDILH